MAAPAVTVENVSKMFRLYHERNQYLKAAILRGRRGRYEEFEALKNVSFEVPVGQTFGIVGSNGSGKSTMLKCLAGILFPERGSITVNGRLAALLELGAGFHPEMSGRENTFLNGAILGLSRKEIERRFDEIVEFSGLEAFIDSPVKNYSSGMVVRLGFAIAINVDPDVLLIDEVLAVGDAAFQIKCAEKIEQFRNAGKTIIVVSHATGQIQELCETALWLEKGDVRMIGSAAEVTNLYNGASHGARPTEAEDLGQRWGSNEAQIAGVALLDAAGEPTTVFATGDTLRLRVEVMAHQRVEGAVLGLRIDSLHGVPLWGTSTRRRNHNLYDLEGPATIEVEVPNLALLEGVYNLTVALTDQTTTHAFDHWEGRVRFEVRQPGIFDRHFVHMPATFRSEVRGRSR